MATRKSGPPKPSRKATRSPRPRVPPRSSPIPVDDSLDALRDAATGCKRCDLWKPATKTVFGAGPDNARVFIVGEQRACRLWLEGELARIKPDVVVCLGAIAARNVLGTKFGLMKQRGTWQVLPDGSRAFATVHPSYLLRLPEASERESAFEAFVRDLKMMREVS